ncbi:uncharacterized protein LOC112009200 [Quercus suber]|uniref:uncharacterized protein LOC112009200 n=1 Tax=Quercus suber TaxID=58331 RepID=UPI0032E0132B
MDSSVLFEADEAVGEPSQTKDNIGMEPVYYNAAAEGKIEVFKDIPKSLNQLPTQTKNTVLHIYLTSLIKESESSIVFVKEILRKCSPLLWQANDKHETPLHIAARYGHAAVVKVLIEHAQRRQQDPESEVKVPIDPESGVDKAVKKMLKMKNKENETAMHEAVRNNHLEVVKLLVENGKDISYSANDAGETPLYMAVERNYREVVFHILENCKSLTHDGPLGGTTLHAAVIWNDDGEIQKNIEAKALSAQKYNQRLTPLLSQKKRFTPLHCAAYFNGYSTIKILLKNDRSMAYKKDAKDMTALHIAADRGHVKTVNEILKYCPDCSELVDKRGWNALHFAVNSSHKDVVNVILNRSSLSNLLNEKDESGNTPLLHSKSLPYTKDLMRHDRVNKMAFNKQYLHAYDIALISEKLSKEKFGDNEIAFPHNRPAEFRKFLGEHYIKPKNFLFGLLQWKEEDYKSRKDRFVSIMKETSETHMIVDTLIATVTFTAGITMPGGFIGQEGPHSGSPVLMRSTAFKAFIITNTIAMVQSCSAAFFQLFMPLLFDEQNLGDFSFLLASLAFFASISAMGTMMMAFVLGTYAVLMHSWDLAVANSVVGLFYFIPVFFICIGCLNYFLEILRVGSSWILDRLYFLCPNCILKGCSDLCKRIVDIFNHHRRD